eukprot:SAG11_NODE_21699_length_420_cov_0.797508_1_plen_60_part_10
MCGGAQVETRSADGTAAYSARSAVAAHVTSQGGQSVTVHGVDHKVRSWIAPRTRSCPRRA